MKQRKEESELSAIHSTRDKLGVCVHLRKAVRCAGFVMKLLALLNFCRHILQIFAG